LPKFPFLQVDAFADRPLAGNPCAVVLDADALDAPTMQAIARENNLSETAFVLRSQVADFRARYFTPAEEIPLAGHPTIATGAALVDSGRLRLEGETTTIRLQLEAGVIAVDVRGRGRRVDRVVMSQKRPEFLRRYEPAEILPLFGLEAGDAAAGLPIETVSTGTPQLMVPLAGHDALRRALVDLRAYFPFRQRSDFFSVHLFCLQGATPEGRTFARHFGTPPDAFEDPFTGSATGGMAAYLWHHRLLDSPRFVAEQGHWMGRPGRAEVEVVGPPDAIETVRVGGAAVVVIRGELEI
jgi:trans-2,3-dihydro-3-hydroxyanthranilate isomerase